MSADVAADVRPGAGPAEEPARRAARVEVPVKGQGPRPCGCKGIRTCGTCAPELHTAAAIAAAAAGGAVPPRREWAYFGMPPQPDDELSAVAGVGEEPAQPQRPPTRWLCLQCGQLVTALSADRPVSSCAGHVGGRVVGPPPAGILVVPGFMSEADERDAVGYLDGADGPADATRWIPSQSGRRKFEVGPQANFKKKKAKVSEAFLAEPFPPAWLPLLARASIEASVGAIGGATAPFAEAVEDAAWAGPPPPQARPISNPAAVQAGPAPPKVPLDADADAAASARLRLGRRFVPVEASALDYDPSKGANLDPHVDDEWIWGERVLGVCLMSDAVMTFCARLDGITCSTVVPGSAAGEVPSSDAPRPDEFRVLLPRRALFAIAGPARHAWLHGIAARDVPARRVSITVRELEPAFVRAHVELSEKILGAATAALPAISSSAMQC